MKDPMAEYRNHLGRYAIPHHRDIETPHLTYWGRAAGLSPEDIIADANAAGVVGREYEVKIRTGWKTADEKIGAREAKRRAEGAGGSCPARRPEAGRGAKAHAARSATPAPAAEVGLVRWLIAEGFDIDDMEKLRHLSPASVCPDDDALALRVSTEWEILLHFGLEEYVFIRPSKASAIKARVGESLRRVQAWFDTPMSRTLDGECMGLNPHTGRVGQTRGGSPSCYCNETVAAYRHMLMEFDHMSLADQCRFWAGVIRRKALPLVCLVFSGNKSIHGTIRADAKTAEEYRDLADDIAARYAVDANPDADPDADFSKHPEKHPEYYRLDVQALRNPLVCVRLAGVVRKDTGKLQTLLYAAPHWFDREFEAELNPTPAAAPAAERIEASVGNPPAASSASPALVPAAPAASSSGETFARRCAECAVRADCEQAFGKFWGNKSHGGVGCDYPLKGRGEAQREVADMKREVALDRLKRKPPTRQAPPLSPLLPFTMHTPCGEIP